MTEFYIAAVLVAASHALQARIGINFADEGAFWNGVLRTRQGRVPIRDFQSYDPGRYYWTWAWMTVFGFGILGLRHSLAVFQLFGLWAGLVAISTVNDSVWALSAAGLICIAWMHPRHKMFEHALSLMAICVIVLAIQNPTPQLFFIAGVYTGFAGFMGRNHGAWTLAAVGSLLVILWLKSDLDNVGWLFGNWFVGIPVGYSPMLIMWVLIPGMARSYWHKMIIVYFFVKRGSDLPIAVPWPWKEKYTQPRLRDRVSHFLIGLNFLGLLVFYSSAFAWIVISPTGLANELLVASCLVGVFYAHHAGSRSDLSHLCQVMQPFLLGLFSVIFSLQSSVLSGLLIVVLAIVSYFTTRNINPLNGKTENPKQFVKYDLNGDKLWLNRNHAKFLTQIVALVGRNPDLGDSAFFAPHTPILYPVLQLRTPMRNDYFLHHESDETQQQTIQDLEANKVDWALIQNSTIDGRDDLRFKNTNTVLWSYLNEKFADFPVDELGKDWRLMKKRDEAQTDVEQLLTS